MSSASSEVRKAVTVRFAGDSGDGMQLTGTQFSNTSAFGGNDLATLPDFPAEIRAPAGSLAGVSGFQVQIGSTEIFTPGDHPDVLVAMNPAALQKNLPIMERGSTLIINKDTFNTRACERVGFETDPLTDGSLDSFHVLEVPISSMTHGALEESSLSHKEKERCKNFFALGLMYWMYAKDLAYTVKWVDTKFGGKPDLAAGNISALKAGYHYGETAEVFSTQYEIPQAAIESGTYRQITGNQATAYGFIAASQLAGVDLFLGSYPITPASDILHELSKHKAYGVKTFQAEDEIAAVSAAIGAAFGGSLALTTTSGPGMALKAEAIGLAIVAELPLVIVDVQRGGPSTGLPTKTEQADLLQALYGRNGESPCIIVAPATPTDCFFMAIEAARLAIRHMMPVIYLSDGYIANGAEPWKLPDVSTLLPIETNFRTEEEGFMPYARDEETLARAWVRPGTPGLEHRLGGLEKEDVTGNVSYEPANHEHMCQLRLEKVRCAQKELPPAEMFGDEEGDLLLIGWGGTYGALHTATAKLHAEGHKVTHLHLRYLNPYPPNLESALKSFQKIAVAELNLGQLRHELRAEFLLDIHGINKVQGQPFSVSELVEHATALLEKK